MNMRPFTTQSVEARCANCTAWDTKDGLTGVCEELTENLKLTDFAPTGMLPCKTVAAGCCTLFAPAEDALSEAQAEDNHMAAMRAEAGASHPASMGGAL